MRLDRTRMTHTAPPQGLPDATLRGILSMLAAVATFAVMDVLLKRMSEFYPAMQVTFLRGAASLPFLFGATALFGAWRDLVPRRWSLHVLRGVLNVLTLWLVVYALHRLSMGNTYSIFMSAPLLITALAVPMLGERVGWRRWLAVGAGLCGVLIVLRPTGRDVISIGGLAALFAAIFYAVGAIIIRIQTRTDTSPAIVLWVSVLTALFSGALAAPGWVSLQPAHWMWIAGLGISGALGQHLITEAFSRASPQVVAPLEYTALLWGMLFDWVLWATMPSARMLTGAGIVVASGIYVIQRERLTARASA
jgi:drug/metabolite transporter (DMT)-like permease